MPNGKTQMGDLIQLYGQLVDRSGQPAGGIGIGLANVGSKQELTGTVSNANGAFVLRLPVPFSPKSQTLPALEFRLSVNKKPIPVEWPPDGLPPGLHGPIRIVVEKRGPSSGLAPQPVLIAPEGDVLNAFMSAPWLFTRGEPTGPPSFCSPNLPSSIASRVIYFNHLVMFPPPGATINWEQVKGPVNFAAALAPLAATSLRWGAVLEFRQEWWDLGHSLGDLLYSVPLAPCEETKVATVDWRRRDYATRQSALDEASFQDTTISRDEVISEAVRMASDKTLSSTTDAGGNAFSLGPFTGGGSQTASNMHDAVSASTDASRNINDRIRQTSNTLRTTRAFAIAEVNQEEESTVRSRVLRNHNHCHTVTFQYYEVLRHYLVSTHLNKAPKPAVFIPFEPLTFDLNAVRSNGYLLRRALLDPTLSATLDYVLGLRQPATPQPLSGQAATSGQADPDVTDFRVGAFGLASPFLWLLVNDEKEVQLSPSTSTPRPIFTASLATPVPLSTVKRLGLHNLGSSDAISLDDLTIEVMAGDGALELYFQPTVDIQPGRVFAVEIERSGLVPSSVSPVTGPVVDIDRLIAHLNVNAVYYTTALIAGTDGGTRYSVMSTLLDGSRHSLADFVSYTPAGFYGNYVAFTLTDEKQLPVSYVGSPPYSEDDLQQAEAPDVRLITLPTPGVFAESELGQCSACETIDNTRFWDWSKSPCPEEAPDINAAMLASRYQDLKDILDVVKSNLTPPPVQVPTEPPPMVTIGDQTLANLTKDLQLTDPKAVLDLVQGLVKTASDNYQSVLKSLSQLLGTTQTGQGGLSSSVPAGGTQAAGGAGGTGAATDAGAGELAATDVITIV